MKQFDTNDFLEKLLKVEPEGLEVAIEKGILKLSHEIFYRNKRIFIYTNQLRYNFEPDESLSISEFQDFYKDTIWVLEN